MKQSLGERVRSRMKVLGLNTKQLAIKANVKRETVSSICSDDTIPGRIVLHNLAFALCQYTEEPTAKQLQEYEHWLNLYRSLEEFLPRDVYAKRRRRKGKVSSD